MEPQRSFETFFRAEEPLLRRSLCARYGAVVGRAAAVDALSYAWEHWDRVSVMDNPVGYLFRVGQSASRRHRPQRIPGEAITRSGASAPAEVETSIDPDLADALSALPERQRLAVLLVHGLGFTQREAARILDVSPSTVQTHVERALGALRARLEIADVH
ncbi:MAG: sigma-70 family RNA polymerase sigma factor [Actinomycetota bacterium]